MKQEDKELLLKDLCARLPYGVIVQWNKCDNPWVPDCKFKAEDFVHLASPFYEIKPYLRPMSSMTPDEFEEFTDIVEHISIGKLQINIANPEAFDWLNAHHFDYRGLIPMGLALEAPNEIYNN